MERLQQLTKLENDVIKCDLNQYGYKCINKCDCDQFHRCNAKVGCILKASFSSTNTTYTGTTEPVLLPNETITTKETTFIKTGTSNVEWIIYTLCITVSFILTGLGHLFRTYRKRHSLDIRIVDDEVILKPLELTSYNDGIYDEVDENPLTFVTIGSNVTSQASHNETINFVFHERQSNTIGNIDDEAGYFDLYFAIEEDVNDQLEDRASQKESLSISSSTSNVVSQDNTECPKLLQEYCQEDSHTFDVTVTVHQCIKRSSWSDEDPTSDIYSNICIPLLKDRQINSQANESHPSSEIKPLS